MRYGCARMAKHGRMSCNKWPIVWASFQTMHKKGIFEWFEQLGLNSAMCPRSTFVVYVQRCSSGLLSEGGFVGWNGLLASTVNGKNVTTLLDKRRPPPWGTRWTWRARETRFSRDTSVPLWSWVTTQNKYKQNTINIWYLLFHKRFYKRVDWRFFKTTICYQMVQEDLLFQPVLEDQQNPVVPWALEDLCLRVSN